MGLKTAVIALSPELFKLSGKVLEVALFTGNTKILLWLSSWYSSKDSHKSKSDDTLHSTSIVSVSAEKAMSFIGNELSPVICSIPVRK